MKKAFATIFVFIIFVGVTGFALNTVFGMNTVTYLDIEQVNGIWIYKYDLWRYIENVRANFTQFANLQIRLPSMNWQNTGNWMQDFALNFVVFSNVFIAFANIIIYPMRVAFYIIQILLALVGLPIGDIATSSESPLAWLGQFTQAIISLQIPYALQ